MRNKLTDVHNHLVAQLERLGDESFTGKKLDEEIRRANAMTGVAAVIVKNADLALRASVAMNKTGGRLALPKLLTE
jgi:hypothetical protein